MYLSSDIYGVKMFSRLSPLSPGCQRATIKTVRYDYRDAIMCKTFVFLYYFYCLVMLLMEKVLTFGL